MLIIIFFAVLFVAALLVAANDKLTNIQNTLFSIDHTLTEVRDRFSIDTPDDIDDET